MRDLPATLRRRWYLSVVGLLATLGICFAAMVAFPPTYEAKASIVLLPPATTVEEGGNPYLQLSDLKQAVDVMTRALTSQSAVDAASAVAPNGTFDVLPDYATNGPIFIITADDKTPEATLATLKVVTDMVAPTLAKLQTALGIAPESQITSSVLTTDEKPATVRKTQIRALIVVAGVALLGSAMTIALVDSFLLRRSHRKKRVLAEAEATHDLDLRDGHSINGRLTGELGSQRSRRIGLNKASSSNEIVVAEAEPTGPRRQR